MRKLITLPSEHITNLPATENIVLPIPDGDAHELDYLISPIAKDAKDKPITEFLDTSGDSWSTGASGGGWGEISRGLVGKQITVNSSPMGEQDILDFFQSKFDTQELTIGELQVDGPRKKLTNNEGSLDFDDDEDQIGACMKKLGTYLKAQFPGTHEEIMRSLRTFWSQTLQYILSGINFHTNIEGCRHSEFFYNDESPITFDFQTEEFGNPKRKHLVLKAKLEKPQLKYVNGQGITTKEIPGTIEYTIKFEPVRFQKQAQETVTVYIPKIVPESIQASNPVLIGLLDGVYPADLDLAIAGAAKFENADDDTFQACQLLLVPDASSEYDEINKAYYDVEYPLQLQALEPKLSEAIRSHEAEPAEDATLLNNFQHAIATDLGAILSPLAIQFKEAGSEPPKNFHKLLAVITSLTDILNFQPHCPDNHHRFFEDFHSFEENYATFMDRLHALNNDNELITALGINETLPGLVEKLNNNFNHYRTKEVQRKLKNFCQRFENAFNETDANNLKKDQEAIVVWLKEEVLPLINSVLQKEQLLSNEGFNKLRLLAEQAIIAVECKAEAHLTQYLTGVANSLTAVISEELAPGAPNGISKLRDLFSFEADLNAETLLTYCKGLTDIDTQIKSLINTCGNLEITEAAAGEAAPREKAAHGYTTIATKAWTPTQQSGLALAREAGRLNDPSKPPSPQDRRKITNLVRHTRRYIQKSKSILEKPALKPNDQRLTEMGSLHHQMEKSRDILSFSGIKTGKFRIFTNLSLLIGSLALFAIAGALIGTGVLSLAALPCIYKGVVLGTAAFTGLALMFGASGGAYKSTAKLSCSIWHATNHVSGASQKVEANRSDLENAYTAAPGGG